MAFHPTTTTFRQGARTMPQAAYVSPEVFEREAELIHARMWNCVGRADRLASRGDWFQARIAGESLIVLRDRRGELRAFFNVCRHRGTRICREDSGHFSETIQCPYHAWTWTTEGDLIGAPHMHEVEGFRKADYPLHRVALAEWEGFLFVNIHETPEPFEAAWATMLGRLSRFTLSRLTPGHRATYDVRANWKLVFQNYSECLHCPLIHPELNLKLGYQTGANDLVDGPFLGGYMELTPPSESATVSGQACGLPINPELPDEEQHRAYYYSLMPNFLLSIHRDYVNWYIVTPLGADRTIVHSEWLFHPDSPTSPGFNPGDAIEFWELTNRQDWDIVVRSQMGISSRRYVPGPYSPRESIPAAWDREYLRRMEQGGLSVGRLGG